MTKTIIGLFANMNEAQDVVRDLMAAGFSRDDISLIARAQESRSAGIGALTDDLPDALARLGVPDQQAEYYIDAVRQGKALVSVTVDHPRVEHAVIIMERHRAEDIGRRAAKWRQGGATHTEPTSTSDSSGSTAYKADFRDNFEVTFGTRGYTYDQCAPAYHYGYTLATDPRYRDQDWGAIEAEAQREWESRNQGAWEEFKDAVRYAWDRVHGRTPRAQLTV